jgi:hypothetical protein
MLGQTSSPNNGNKSVKKSNYLKELDGAVLGFTGLCDFLIFIFKMAFVADKFINTYVTTQADGKKI